MINLDDLKTFFEKFGGIQDAIVLRDVNTNVSRGFGFVTFDSEEVADRCVQENDYQIKGKKVDIKKAEPKQVNQKQSRYINNFTTKLELTKFHWKPGIDQEKTQ